MSFDLFGKRGAIAAQLIISNWTELERAMGESTPNIIDSLMAQVSAVSTFMQFWKRTLSLFKTRTIRFFSNFRSARTNL